MKKKNTENIENPLIFPNEEIKAKWDEKNEIMDNDEEEYDEIVEYEEQYAHFEDMDYNPFASGWSGGYRPDMPDDE